MLSVLAVVALLLSSGGAWYASSYTENAADRVLRSAATAISETLAVEQGRAVVAVPVGAFSFLEDSGRDSVFYNVSQDQRVLTGYSGLGLPPDEEGGDADTSFRYGEIFGREVRIATQVRKLPRQKSPVVVQVAETLTERHNQMYQILAGLIGLEMMLVVIAGLLIRPAVRWGLKPVASLQKQLVRSDGSVLDVKPLDTNGVPMELLNLVDGFNQLIHRLGEALASHRQFTGDASHQLRTPLAIIKAHIALLKSADLDSAGSRSSIADIESAASRLGRLLSQLLSLARAEGERPDIPPKRVRLDMLTADVSRQAVPAAINAGIDIQFECQHPIVVTSHPLIIAEIVGNLIDNAVRYNHRGGSVFVRVGLDNESAFVEIEDDGPGIPIEDRANVFKRFQRLDRDHLKSGSGLGLPIAKALANSLSGSLELYQRSAGSGCRFRLTFNYE
jgi:two-component system sensor histidine kinase TctE